MPVAVDVRTVCSCIFAEALLVTVCITMAQPATRNVIVTCLSTRYISWGFYTIGSAPSSTADAPVCVNQVDANAAVEARAAVALEHIHVTIDPSKTDRTRALVGIRFYCNVCG